MLSASVSVFDFRRLNEQEPGSEGSDEFSVGDFACTIDLCRKDSMIDWSEVLRFSSQGNPQPSSRVERSEEEWMKLLTPAQFEVMRRKGTERPFSGQYCEAHEPGRYNCACCGSTLFDSTLKFDSGTGWPSFAQPANSNAISYHRDDSYGMVRVEVCCNTCDAHLGHVFPDGPPPSGLRYCINSLSLKKAD